MPASFLPVVLRRVVSVTSHCDGCAGHKEAAKNARRDADRFRAIANRYCDDNERLRAQLLRYEADRTVAV